MSIDAVLDRLQGVKRTGPNKWIACCPSHEDRQPSLSIRALEDGRILLHDFGGCEVDQVLSALNLPFPDLFPQALGEFKPCGAAIPARDLLVILDTELLVAVLILTDVVQHRTVNEPQIQRLLRAVSRIGQARDLISPERVSNHAV
jgi:hypothetical protein